MSKEIFSIPIYPQPDELPINGRIYPKDVYEKAINNFIKEKVKTKKAFITHGLTQENFPDSPLNSTGGIIDDIKNENGKYIAIFHTLENNSGKHIKNILKSR